MLLFHCFAFSHASEASGSVRFQLEEAPDSAYSGFGFTARGAAPDVEKLVIRCEEVTVQMLASPPPAADCPLGASFSYLEQWAGGFEAEVCQLSEGWVRGVATRGVKTCYHDC